MDIGIIGLIVAILAILITWYITKLYSDRGAKELENAIIRVLEELKKEQRDIQRHLITHSFEGRQSVLDMIEQLHKDREKKIQSIIGNVRRHKFSSELNKYINEMAWRNRTGEDA